jgi:hypothetical protein
MSACPDTRAELTLEEAFVVLEPYFLEMRRLFVKKRAKRCSAVILEVESWVHDSPRHFAATYETGKIMLAAPEMAELPEETILAIFAHEFGHAVDFLYPGDYMLVDDGELILLPAVPQVLINKKAEQAMLARARAWERRDEDTVERTADAIGEKFTGQAIGYCGPCSVQCFARGRPRPAGLR